MVEVAMETIHLLVVLVVVARHHSESFIRH
jgi:hypothetical protein